MKLGPMMLAATGLALGLAAPARADDCKLRVSAPWKSAGQGYAAEAASDGASCKRAKISLTLKGPDGKALHSYRGDVESNLQFAEAKSKAAMKKELLDWITRNQQFSPTTAKLPDWKDKQDQPSDGEFAFYVDEGLKRPAYLAIRKANRPMFCYVSGSESQTCVMLGTDGAVKSIGAQALPG